jgi:hypothetical protein
MDPEVRFGDNGWASGVDLGLYPQSRIVMFGLSADFYNKIENMKR